MIPVQSTRLFGPKNQGQVIPFDLFPHGINRQLGPKQLTKSEMVECINFKYDQGMRLRTRPGLTLVTTTGTVGGAAIIYMAAVQASVEGVPFDKYTFGEEPSFGGGETGKEAFLVVADENYKIYYLSGSALVPINATNYTAAGKPYLTPFAGYLIIMDGEELKYWDSLYFRLCYDLGTGTGGHQFDYTGYTQESNRDLDNTVTRYGSTFKTQHWTTGFTIPLRYAHAMLQKYGSPTGNICAKLYATSAGVPTGSALATSANVDASTIPSTSTKTTFTFDADSPYYLEPDTTYFLSLEFTGTASNYIECWHDDVTSGSTAYYYDTDWHAGTEIPCISVQPGKPPRASFGCAWQNRLWFVDPDNPGWVRFSNANSPFDFSTANGAGYIGSIDDNAVSFPVGAIMPHYGDLYVVGTTMYPYLSKIMGTNLADYAQSVLLMEISCSQLAMASTMNDIWFANKSSVFSLRGVQEYGDIRSNDPGHPIAPTVQQYYDDSAVAGFNPVDGQFWLKMAGYDRILVCHTRFPSKLGDSVRFPWTEFLFTTINPTSFAFYDQDFYIGGEDGFVYALTGEYLDDETQPAYTIKTGILEFPFRSTLITEMYLSIGADDSFTFDLDFYKNGGTSPFLTKNISGQDDRIAKKLQFQARSMQLGLDNFVITCPIDVGEIFFQGTPMEIA